MKAAFSCHHAKPSDDKFLHTLLALLVTLSLKLLALPHPQKEMSQYMLPLLMSSIEAAPEIILLWVQTCNVILLALKVQLQADPSEQVNWI